MGLTNKGRFATSSNNTMPLTKAELTAKITEHLGFPVTLSEPKWSGAWQIAAKGIPGRVNISAELGEDDLAAIMPMIKDNFDYFISRSRAGKNKHNKQP